MTVIEVMPPAVRPDTAREERARTLEAAALEIEMRGWCQGRTEDDQGRVCLLGAVEYAAGGTLAVLEFFPAGMATIAALWNDKTAHAADQVTHLLRWRAEEIRDGWDA